ncbi:hypothetical protein [uncultured Shewanella sp.]|nr:hypothetical protein [uncultured Shewanella sp.]
MPVTPLYPLWFVEQAVTRKTWTYPHLAGGGEVFSPEEGLHHIKFLWL